VRRRCRRSGAAGTSDHGTAAVLVPALDVVGCAANGTRCGFRPLLDRESAVGAGATRVVGRCSSNVRIHVVASPFTTEP
jgi:hypothetical protein